MTLELYGRNVSFLAVGTNAGVPRSPAAIGRSIKGSRGCGGRWPSMAASSRFTDRIAASCSITTAVQSSSSYISTCATGRDRRAGPLKGLYREFSDEELERMDRVYIVNESGALMLRAEHPTMADRVEFLPVWFDATTFHPVDAAQRERLRANLAARIGIRPEAAKSARYVLSAGRLTEIKKPLLAVETLAELKDESAHLVVAGSGEFDADFVTAPPSSACRTASTCLATGLATDRPAHAGERRAAADRAL